MAWIYLSIAGIFEIGWAIGLKYSTGFTKPIPTIITISLMILSFVFLGQALKTIPVGTAYAIWTGIGAVGTAILGVILFNEPRDIGRILCILLIICGLIGLKLTTE
ncbi:MAG: quaternary ammonium compound efflux SMR transporter SugE [Bacteroidetes bacterium]|jgi:quaternary ammonium compound-resistance protein SugE|nr:quaternary ammonium compound efflux SMR transporter SugE [Bacteroidota bacterium]